MADLIAMIAVAMGPPIGVAMASRKFMPMVHEVACRRAEGAMIGVTAEGAMICSPTEGPVLLARAKRAMGVAAAKGAMIARAKRSRRFAAAKMTIRASFGTCVAGAAAESPRRAARRGAAEAPRRAPCCWRSAKAPRRLLLLKTPRRGRPACRGRRFPRGSRSLAFAGLGIDAAAQDERRCAAQARAGAPPIKDIEIQQRFPQPFQTIDMEPKYYLQSTCT